MKTYFRVSAFLLAITCFAVACKKKDNTNSSAQTIPFQGPQNPSFENGSAAVATSWNGGWLRTSVVSPPMPMNGTYYMSTHITKDTTIDLYQDNVDLSHSTKLSFGWDVVCCPDNDTTTLYVLFSSNKIDTLWSKKWSWSSSFSGNDTIGSFGAAVNLPSLPIAGRLIFRAGYNASSAYTVVGVDNITVQ